MAETNLEQFSWPETIRRVNEAIKISVLGANSYIQNAFPAVLEKAPEGHRRTREQLKAPGWKSLKPPAMDTCQYLPASIAPGGNARARYLAEGLAKFEKNPKDQFFYGVCNDFAWAVNGALVATTFKRPELKVYAPLLPAGTRVELYGIVGLHEDKHLFTVVNRPADSSPTDFRTWGRGCFVVDQWYGLQTTTPAVKSFDPHDDLPGEGFHDLTFIGWWNEVLAKVQPKSGIGNKLAPQAEFSAGGE
ncbi:hypothetical protein [Frankia sp. QA3]|uniref:hypothetical protein n=1 Tax=Frankia sp. QA3 TaxID=710111 RepID=UPI000269CE96|nr:hypothetical protein [Frankia sp. QA3]EIV96213.1 hypothetical protein FraQA3DRAFT_6083 [Frankia sp. QA3]